MRHVTRACLAAGAALATAAILIVPAVLTRPQPEPAPVAQQPDYPAWMFEAPYAEPDWAVMERCWVGRSNSPATTPAGCAGEYPLSLPCHWTVDYPDRRWVELACGPVNQWGPEFGFGWYGHWDPHPGRDWVARIRAGGQP